MPSLWVANAEEVLPEDDPGYDAFVESRTLRMMPRFLLGLRPGDCLVLPTALPEDFSRYVARLLRLREPLSLQVRQRSRPYSLVDSLEQDADARAAFEERRREGGWTLEPFLQTERVARLAAETGIPTAPTPPGLVLRLNDKAWFKEFAAGLGVATVPGRVAASREALAAALHGREDFMLRKTRSAGGAGNRHGSREDLLEWYDAGSVLVEPFLPFDSVAGSLARLDDDGIRFLGIDRQVLQDGSWCGFDFPNPDGAIRERAGVLAEAIHAAGGRGYLNLDWGLLAGEPLLLECNFRHNGFAYVTDFAERYFGAGWEGLAIHCREGLPTTAGTATELLGRLAALRLQGGPVLIDAPGAARGAVLTVPPADGAFSVAVFAADREYARQALALVQEAA